MTTDQMIAIAILAYRAAASRYAATQAALAEAHKAHDKAIQDCEEANKARFDARRAIFELIDPDLKPIQPAA